MKSSNFIKNMKKVPDKDIYFLTREKVKEKPHQIKMSVQQVIEENNSIYLKCTKDKNGMSKENIINKLLELNMDFPVFLKYEEMNLVIPTNIFERRKKLTYVVEERSLKTNLDTIISFVEKNDYSYKDDGSFIYIQTKNDNFKIPKCELLADDKEVTLYHGHGIGCWHNQGNHKWDLIAVQKHIYYHEFKTHTNFSRKTVVIDADRKERGILYGTTWL